jgi:hypothetical protein
VKPTLTQSYHREGRGPLIRARLNDPGPISGDDGNKEYLLAAARGESAKKPAG